MGHRKSLFLISLTIHFAHVPISYTNTSITKPAIRVLVQFYCFGVDKSWRQLVKIIDNMLCFKQHDCKRNVLFTFFLRVELSNVDLKSTNFDRTELKSSTFWLFFKIKTPMFGVKFFKIFIRFKKNMMIPKYIFFFQILNFSTFFLKTKFSKSKFILFVV